MVPHVPWDVAVYRTPAGIFVCEPLNMMEAILPFCEYRLDLLSCA